MRLAWRIINISQIISMFCLHSKSIALRKRGSVADEYTQSLSHRTPSTRSSPNHTHITFISITKRHILSRLKSKQDYMLRFEVGFGLISSVPNTLRNVSLRPASFHKMTWAYFPVPEALVICHEDAELTLRKERVQLWFDVSSELCTRVTAFTHPGLTGKSRDRALAVRGRASLVHGMPLHLTAHTSTDSFFHLLSQSVTNESKGVNV